MNDCTILHYTASCLPPHFAQVVRDRLVDAVAGAPIISISQEPLDFGWNLCVGRIGVSVQNVYRQILVGAKAADTEYVACAEDDTLYPAEHFAYRPALGVFAYNLNSWRLDLTNPPVFRWRNRTNMCSCVCHRQDLIDTLEARFAADPAFQFNKSWGEPGKYEWKFGIPRVQREQVQTTLPVIQVNHGGLYGVRKRVKTDRVAETLPGWGSAAGLWEVLRG